MIQNKVARFHFSHAEVNTTPNVILPMLTSEVTAQP